MDTTRDGRATTPAPAAVTSATEELSRTPVPPAICTASVALERRRVRRKRLHRAFHRARHGWGWGARYATAALIRKPRSTASRDGWQPEPARCCWTSCCEHMTNGSRPSSNSDRHGLDEHGIGARRTLARRLAAPGPGGSQWEMEAVGRQDRGGAAVPTGTRPQPPPRAADTAADLPTTRALLHVGERSRAQTRSTH